jgi:hypothetical protein
MSSFAGISDNDVSASAGLTKVGNGKYNMSPGGGTEVVISVSGKMSDGKVATDKSIQNKRYSRSNRNN